MLIVILIVVVIVIAIANSGSNTKRIAALKKEYDQLLLGNDRRAALKAGRAYYSAVRKDKTLTIYDEQAITNDLSAMATLQPENHVVNHQTNTA